MRLHPSSRLKSQAAETSAAAATPFLQNRRTSPGFTFIEVISAAVIVAVLAAVAIPIYTGYIKTQRQSMVNNLAQTAAVSANLYFRRNNDQPDSADLKLFLPNPAMFTLEVTATDVIITEGTGSDKVTGTAAYRP